LPLTELPSQDYSRKHLGKSAPEHLAADTLGHEARQADHRPFEEGYIAGWQSARGADDHPVLIPRSGIRRGDDVSTMNVKDTLSTIRALGLVADRVGGEWRINYRNSHKGSVRYCPAYCTSDKDDALATARAMSKWKDEHPTKRIKLLEEWKEACAKAQPDQRLR
jgi:hypothetical protein